MAKKGKKGGKKGGKKKAEPQEADLMTEVEKELFQIQISDLMQKVERMKTRCLELEMSNEEYQKRYEQLDEDRADIIAYLKRMLQEKEDEITELKERLEGLQKTLEQERLENKEKIEHLEHEFKIMHEQLTSEIKLLTGKLNSLEEFRLQRDDLMKKFKIQEQEMEDQEQRHKRTLYEVERKFIIGKDKLKKEMEARLLQLSMDFQDATHIRIAATTHRTIRENIAVNNELEKMLETQRNLRVENISMKERDRNLNLEIQLREEERDIVLAKNMVQLKLINRLSTEYDDMAKNIGTLQNAAQHAVHLDNILEETRNLHDRAEKHIAILEEKLQALTYQNNESTSQLLESNVARYHLQKVLWAAVKSIKEALEVQLHPSLDEAFSLSRRENLLSNLLQLLNTADLSDFQDTEQKLVTLTETSAVYVIGDLGLVPRSSTDLRVEGVESHYTVGSNISVESLQPSMEGSHPSSVLEVGSSKSDMSETKSKSSEESKTRIKAKGSSEVSVMSSELTEMDKEEDDISKFQDVHETSFEQQGTGEYVESDIKNISELQNVDDTLEPKTADIVVEQQGEGENFEPLTAGEDGDKTPDPK